MPELALQIMQASFLKMLKYRCMTTGCLGKYLEIREGYMDNGGYSTLKTSVNYILRRELQ
jgi:hypothetical protein